MEVIHVPPPSKEAFHKGRPMSDLIKAQIKHFKHVEEKLSPRERESIPQHRITTENEAAQYITAMTRLLRSDVDEKPAKPNLTPITVKKSAPRAAARGFAIAASEAPIKPRKQSKTKSSRKKK
ncbi:MAG TPA: hypothetical protein VN753_02625 [Terracidiphilus sp.]|jgi:hypothetical protein|nr:hypothetical protein [Terracidiphilus sp.]